MRCCLTFSILALLTGSGIHPYAAYASLPTCTIVSSRDVPAAMKKGRPVEPAKKVWVLDDDTLIWLGSLTIDADGHPEAYHPNPGPGSGQSSAKGLDHLANAGKPGKWWALATDAPGCGASGRPVLQGLGDPAPGFYVSKTTMEDPARPNCRDQRRYVHSGEVSFIAVSPKIRGYAPALALVRNLNGDRESFAVVADIGPRTGIGEGSMRLAQSLGYSPNPRRGGTHARQNLFILMKDTMGFAASDEAVQQAGAAAFKAWGGKPREALCLAELQKRKRLGEASGSPY